MNVSRRAVLGTLAVPLCGCNAIDSQSSTRDRTTPSRDCSETDDAVWGSFQGDERNTGATSAVPELESEPEVSTIADGFVAGDYGGVLDENTVYAVSGAEVEAIDRADGSSAWTYDLDEIAATKPALACGTVVVQTTNELRGIDAVEGTERWRIEAGSGIFDPAMAVVSDGVAVGTNGAALVDPASGETTWEESRDDATLGLGADGDALSLATVDTDGERGAVVTYGLENGEHRWTYDEIEFETQTANVSDPVVGDELVYVADTDGGLHVIDEDGSPAWTHSFGRLTVTSQPVLHSSGTLVVNVGNDRETVAFDAATGDVEWRTPMAHFGSEYALAGGDVVYVGTGAGLRALSVDDGSELWRIDGVGASHPLAATGRSILSFGSRLRELTAAD